MINDIIYNEKPINYTKEHYQALMKGKVKNEDMNKIVTENLEMMDKLLENRKIEVSETAATKSPEALIAYLNQSDCGHWIIERYAHCSEKERQIFVRGMNEVLPHVANRDAFIAGIKYSMKKNLCENLALDCFINDLMAVSTSESILTEEGFELIKNKYAEEIRKFMDEMTQQYQQETAGEEEETDEYIQ